MAVVHAVHNRENPYVMINRQLIDDDDISSDAFRLIMRCLSRPVDWKFRITELCNLMKMTKKKIYELINELIEKGYALKYEFYDRDDNGKFIGSGVEYIFFEFKPTHQEKKKYLDKFKKFFRCSHLRTHPFRKHILNTDNVLNTKEEQQQQPIKEPRIVDPKPVVVYQQKIYQCLEKEDFPLEEKIFLTKKYTEEEVNLALKFADCQKEYKSCRIACVKWACREKPKITETSEEIFEKNKVLAKNLENNLENSLHKKGYTVAASKDCISFYSGANHGGYHVTYGTKNFKDQVKEILRKWNLIGEPLCPI